MADDARVAHVMVRIDGSEDTEHRATDQDSNHRQSHSSAFAAMMAILMMMPASNINDTI
jgi:hypothetical protein